MKLKLNQLTRTLLLCGAFAVVPQKSMAFAGFGDMNADGMMNLMNQMTGMMDVGTGVVGQLTQLKGVFTEAFKEQKEARQEARQNAETAQASANKSAMDMQLFNEATPDVNACRSMRSGAMMTGAIASSANNAVNYAMKSGEAQRSTGESQVGVHNRTTQYNTYFCTQDQAKAGQCSNTQSKYSGLGGNTLIGAGEVKVENGRVTVLNNTVTPEQANAARAQMAIQNGKMPVVETNENINKQAAGAEYNDASNTYLARFNVATTINDKYLADSIANPALAQHWNAMVTDATYKEMYGAGAKRPSAPSSEDVLKFMVNKNFTEVAMASGSLGGQGKASEAEYRAMSLKLLMDIRDAQRDQNRLMAAMLQQAMNPITMADLENKRIEAAKGVTFQPKSGK